MPPGSSVAAAALVAPALAVVRESGGSRLMAFISLGLSAPARPALRRSGGVAALVGRLAEGSEVPVDHRVAREQGDDPAEGEEGAERDRGLAAFGDALAGHDQGSDERAGDQRDEDGGADGAAQEEAEHAGQLDVSHTHPAWVR